MEKDIRILVQLTQVALVARGAEWGTCPRRIDTSAKFQSQIRFNGAEQEDGHLEEIDRNSSQDQRTHSKKPKRLLPAFCVPHKID